LREALSLLRKAKNQLEEMALTMPPEFFGSEEEKQAYFSGWSDVIERLQEIADRRQRWRANETEAVSEIRTLRAVLAQLQQTQPEDEGLDEKERRAYQIGWSAAITELDCIIYRAEHPGHQDMIDQRLEQSKASAMRVLENIQQMTARSGPIYECARERSRIVSAAWRQAGRPRRVITLWTVDGPTYWVEKADGSREAASAEQAKAWGAWVRARARLRADFKRER
jgi:hypothetical protein